MIFQVNKVGMILKSQPKNRNMITRVQIKSEVFSKWKFQSKNDEIIEFCLPYNELKHIVDRLCDENNKIILINYPYSDCKLKVTIPESFVSDGTLFEFVTEVIMDTYHSSEHIDFNYKFLEEGIAS